MLSHGSQKRLEISKAVWILRFQDWSDPLRVQLHGVVRDPWTQERDGCHSVAALPPVHLHLVTAENSKYLRHTSVMFLPRGTMNNNLIEVQFYPLYTLQHATHDFLEGWPTRANPNGHCV